MRCGVRRPRCLSLWGSGLAWLREGWVQRDIFRLNDGGLGCEQGGQLSPLALIWLQDRRRRVDRGRVERPQAWCLRASLCWRLTHHAFLGKDSSSKSLPFRKIQHSITAQDHQPTPDSCILSMVVGQLQADDDQVIGFQQTFLLKCLSDTWVCTNEVFRLALHNF
uniref:nuclear transport factor 2 isoform X2 n=1 Tax=Pristiophorus japonicus TaxID=55135 RepID=UPI00398ED91F